MNNPFESLFGNLGYNPNYHSKELEVLQEQVRLLCNQCALMAIRELHKSADYWKEQSRLKALKKIQGE